MFAIISRLI